MQNLIVMRDLAAALVRRASSASVTCVCAPASVPLSSASLIDKLAIFVVFADALEPNHLRAIDALAAAGYAIMLVNNKPFHDPAALPAHVTFVIENHNVGRDMGGYLRALCFVEHREARAEHARVLFLNDSVMFLSGATQVFERLARAPDTWADITETRQGGCPVTTWCFQLSLWYRDVFRHEHPEMLCDRLEALLGEAIANGCRRALLDSDPHPRRHLTSRLRRRMGVH